ncbi:MAG TPA: DUF4432 family protein [Streptosporangiaceae bacterium]|nr:DUF4432 family protein [Streptosporangiaceae bacterium]
MYAHELTTDPGGLVRARLVNDRLGLAFELEYDQSQFPSFFQWLHLREGAYAVGFEPSTHAVGGEAVLAGSPRDRRRPPASGRPPASRRPPLLPAPVPVPWPQPRRWGPNQVDGALLLPEGVAEK